MIIDLRLRSSNKLTLSAFANSGPPSVDSDGGDISRSPATEGRDGEDVDGPLSKP